MSTTVGTDCYCTLTQANDYFSSRPDCDEWNSLTDDKKEVEIKYATRVIDRNVQFIGRKKDVSQKLQFPRFYLDDTYYVGEYETDLAIDSNLYGGYNLVEFDYPDELVEAVCEQALWRLQGKSTRQERQAQGLSQISMGNVTETYKDSTPSLICPAALACLDAYLVKGASIC